MTTDTIFPVGFRLRVRVIRTSVRAILTHLGEPDQPPPVSPCRGSAPLEDVWLSRRSRPGPLRTGVRIRSKRDLSIQLPRYPCHKRSGVGNHHLCTIVATDRKIIFRALEKHIIFRPWRPCPSGFRPACDPFTISIRLDDRLYRSKSGVGSPILNLYPSILYP